MVHVAQSLNEISNTFIMEHSLIGNVSDTALWIAAYRAQEAERQDAVFKDKLARRLAGERGNKMAADMPHSKAMAFAMVVRTAAIDRLVAMAVSKGVDTVINLGAGLDTRPYRMDLPRHLKWIEVDFPAMIDYKNKQLTGERPACELERIAIDLSSDSQCEMLFCELGDETEKALVISEGMIGYLTNDQAANLSKHLHAIPTFKFWIQDYTQGGMRSSRHTREIGKQLANAPWQFNCADPLAFFAEHGWKVSRNLHILDEADRIGRSMPMMFPWSIFRALFPRKARELGNKTYGYVLFERG